MVLLATIRLHIESPPELARVRSRLEEIDRQGLADIAAFVGMNEEGPPIRVILAQEDSEWARGVAPWIAGFATGSENFVVLFPSRSPSYPDSTLEDVLRHEVAHVLLWRAAGGRDFPRWFNEGLAMAVERRRRIEDQTQLLYQLVTGSRADFAEIDRLFSGGQRDQARAYALSCAIVHDVITRYGTPSAREILSRVRQGESFEAALEAVTGRPASLLETEFWKRQRIWTAWAPILTSSPLLWLGITLLALLAIYMRRRINREIEERWKAEDGVDDDNMRQ